MSRLFLWKKQTKIKITAGAIALGDRPGGFYNFKEQKIMKNEYTRKEVQTLIDATFEIAIRMHQGDLKFENRDECGKYIAQQLKQLGFSTTPRGSSWGVLS